MPVQGQTDLTLFSLEAVQAIHGLGHILFEQDVGGAQGFVQRGVDQVLFTAGGLGQDEASHLLFAAGMADPETQPEEVIVVAHLGDDVLEAVMATVTTTLLELGDARRQIQFVMGYQNRFRLNLIKTRQCGHRLAREVHIGVRDEQPHILPLDQDAGSMAEELGFFTQADIVPAGQLLHIPGARVVAGLGIFRAGVAQSDDQFDFACHA